jgi:hypothetical protein
MAERGIRAPAGTLGLHPTPTPGYQAPGNPAPNIPNPGFEPRGGEGQMAARSRVLDTVRQIVRSNGGEPAENS